MVTPVRQHTRFEKARIIGARALQISMGAPLYVSEDELRENFMEELVQLFGTEDAQARFVLDPLKIATLEYESHRIPIDVDPHIEEDEDSTAYRPLRGGEQCFRKSILKRLTAGLIVLTFLVIAFGGLIRVSDAGESCPDWPTCFGTWGFDISPEEQERWWNENPDEIDSRGEHHRYTTFEIFTEWFHRLLAGAILGPLVILNWLTIRRNEDTSRNTIFASNLSLGLIIWQGTLRLANRQN